MLMTIIMVLTVMTNMTIFVAMMRCFVLFFLFFWGGAEHPLAARSTGCLLQKSTGGRGPKPTRDKIAKTFD